MRLPALSLAPNPARLPTIIVVPHLGLRLGLALAPRQVQAPAAARGIYRVEDQVTLPALLLTAATVRTLGAYTLSFLSDPVGISVTHFLGSY
jgi:hypothetical protein